MSDNSTAVRYNSMSERRSFTIAVPKSFHDALVSYARENGSTLSIVTRKALRETLERAGIVLSDEARRVS